MLNIFGFCFAKTATGRHEYKNKDETDSNGWQQLKKYGNLYFQEYLGSPV